MAWIKSQKHYRIWKSDFTNPQVDEDSSEQNRVAQPSIREAIRGRGVQARDFLFVVVASMMHWIILRIRPKDRLSEQSQGRPNELLTTSKYVELPTTHENKMFIHPFLTEYTAGYTHIMISRATVGYQECRRPVALTLESTQSKAHCSEEFATFLLSRSFDY
jgi:hypothetical protein